MLLAALEQPARWSAEWHVRHEKEAQLCIVSTSDYANSVQSRVNKCAQGQHGIPDCSL